MYSSTDFFSLFFLKTQDVGTSPAVAEDVGEYPALHPEHRPSAPIHGSS